MEIYLFVFDRISGVAGFPVHHCAQEYFRALDSSRNSKSLKDVFLVNKDEKKVTDVCCMISRCCENSYIDHIDAELRLSTSNLPSMKCYIKDHKIYSIVSDAVVIRVDKNFSGYENEVSDLLSHSADSFKRKVEEQERISHASTSIISIQSSGIFKTVIFAVVPKWKTGAEDYEMHVDITMKHIFEKAGTLKAESIAFPVLCLDGEYG